MRYVFRRATPPFTRVLFIESGSRGILDRLIPLLYQVHGREMELDLVTCFEGTPEGFRGRVYRVQNYQGGAARRQLFAELLGHGYTVTGIVCSNEPLMTKWKWALAARLRGKVLIVNENADCMWLDWGHARHLARLVRVRLGLMGASVIPVAARLLLWPFTLAYLLLYAAVVHTRRRIRML